jgi:phosphopantetheine--protein transferase-like protein
MTTGTEGAWVTCPRPNPQARLRLFCFPYAGGGTAIFRLWPASLPNVEVCPIRLPGREARLREPPFTRLGPLVEALAKGIRPHLDKPFAFFGHSMGSLIAFELARHLRDRLGLSPVHLFVSGRGGPQFMAGLVLHTLPEQAFRDELRRLQGTPAEVLDNEELMTFFGPMLRADFAVVETYTYLPGPPLDCPLSAFGGLQDANWGDEEGVAGWREHTRGPFRLRMLPGHHFFVNTAAPLVLQAIAEDLSVVEGEQPDPSSPSTLHPPPSTRTEWRPAAEAPALASGDVHVWRAGLDRDESAVRAFRRLLSPQEQERADRFHFHKDRRHFTVARGLLRTLVARHLGCRPEEVQFRYNAHGKPLLAEAGPADLRFNVSHSHGLALFALTRGRDVGVDVERARPDFAGEDLARRFFAPAEVAVLLALPAEQRREAFFACWTRKEAYIKAVGKGLALPLDRFEVSLRPGEPAALLAVHDDPREVARWSMRHLDPGPGYAGALAVEGYDWRLWCGECSEDLPGYPLTGRG